MNRDRLQYCRELALEVENLDDQIEQLRTKAVSRKWPDGLPHCNVAADRLSGIVAKIADLDAARAPLQTELSDLKQIIEQGMQCLAPKERRLIRLRYFRGLDWDEVAEEMHYSSSWLYEVHRKVLEKMKDHSKT